MLARITGMATRTTTSTTPPIKRAATSGFIDLPARNWNEAITPNSETTPSDPPNPPSLGERDERQGGPAEDAHHPDHDHRERRPARQGGRRRRVLYHVQHHPLAGVQVQPASLAQRHPGRDDRAAGRAATRVQPPRPRDGGRGPGRRRGTGPRRRKSPGSPDGGRGRRPEEAGRSSSSSSGTSNTSRRSPEAVGMSASPWPPKVFRFLDDGGTFSSPGRPAAGFLGEGRGLLRPVGIEPRGALRALQSLRPRRLGNGQLDPAVGAVDDSRHGQAAPRQFVRLCSVRGQEGSGHRGHGPEVPHHLNGRVEGRRRKSPEKSVGKSPPRDALDSDDRPTRPTGRGGPVPGVRSDFSPFPHESSPSLPQIERSNPTRMAWRLPTACILG